MTPAARCRFSASGLMALATGLATVNLLRFRHARTCGPDSIRTARRARTIGLYVLHVAISMSMTDLARLSGLHHSSVSRGIALVEDLRDDPAFDAMVEGIERDLLAHAGFAAGRGGCLDG